LMGLFYSSNHMIWRFWMRLSHILNKFQIWMKWVVVNSLPLTNSEDPSIKVPSLSHIHWNKSCLLIHFKLNICSFFIQWKWYWTRLFFWLFDENSFVSSSFLFFSP
jgi:hypothetical protein